MDQGDSNHERCLFADDLKCPIDGCLCDVGSFSVAQRMPCPIMRRVEDSLYLFVTMVGIACRRVQASIFDTMNLLSKIGKCESPILVFGSSGRTHDCTELTDGGDRKSVV